MPKTITIRMHKKKKSVRVVPKRTLCIGCEKVFDRRELIQDEEDFVRRCLKCHQKHVRQSEGVVDRVEEDQPGWYAISVEAGQDKVIRRKILREAKLAGLKHQILDVFPPTTFADIYHQKAGEVIRNEEGETIGGHAPFPRECRTAAQAKIRELGGIELVDKDMETAYLADIERGVERNPGYRISIYRSEKFGWEWKLRAPSTAPRELKTVRVLKYPGYLIMHCIYSHKLHDLLRKIKGFWGFLIEPVATDFAIKITTSKKRGFLWKVLHRETGQIIHKGSARERGKAETIAEKALAETTSFQPSPLASSEAAEVWLREKAARQIDRDKEAKEKPNITYAVGDRVLATEGQFENSVVKVLEFIDKDKITCTVKVELSLWGNPIPVTVPWHHLKKV